MEDPRNFERNLTLISQAVANMAHKDQPNITEGEIKMAARNFAEFILVLKTIDAERKAANVSK